jgi:hypothetical protein
MFKLAFAAGICAEWLSGPTAHSWPGLGAAGFRALMLTLAVWIALEALRVLWRAVLTLEHRR